MFMLRYFRGLLQFSLVLKGIKYKNMSRMAGCCVITIVVIIWRGENNFMGLLWFWHQLGPQVEKRQRHAGKHFPFTEMTDEYETPKVLRETVPGGWNLST